MMRVVHCNPTWLPQTQTWIYTQLTCVPEKRVESHVVCEKVENRAQFPFRHLHDFSSTGIFEQVWDRGLRRIGVRRHLGFLPRVARRIGAAILHSHFGDVAWVNIGAARAARCGHVVTFYGYDMSQLPRLALWRDRFRELFHTADLVLCEGPHMARCVAGLGCPEAKLRVHHLGIDLEKLPFRPRQWSPGSKLRVLIAATFTEKKGIPYAIEALGRLRRHVDFEVTLIGDARRESEESRREKRAILAAIQAQGLTERTRVLGYQAHSTLIQEAYRHHLFLSPSVTAADGATEGGAPVSIVEMAASGMLIVGTRHCDIPAVIDDAKTGFLAEERDVEGLLHCLVRAIRDPKGWPQMLASGRKHIEGEFNARIQGERLASHYETLVGG
jgi:colanic acid/amylovoran/stewartan biosynthesis glycosyltransferase WcaL/AmsK/CpsK